MRHRGLLVLAVLVLLAPTSVAAQPVGGGFKGGVIFADLPNLDQVIENSMGTSMRTGFAFGGFLTFGERFVLQPEVLYAQKGATAEEFGLELKVEIAMLEVPVLARYNFGTGSTRGYVFGGPSFNFKLDAVMKAEFEGEEEEEDLDDDVESFEFAIVVGAGVEFGPVLVEGRFSEGFTDLAKDEEDFDDELRSRTFAVLVGFRF